MQNAELKGAAHGNLKSGKLEVASFGRRNAQKECVKVLRILSSLSALADREGDRH